MLSAEIKGRGRVHVKENYANQRRLRLNARVPPLSMKLQALSNGGKKFIEIRISSNK